MNTIQTLLKERRDIEKRARELDAAVEHVAAEILDVVEDYQCGFIEASEFVSYVRDIINGERNANGARIIRVAPDIKR